MNRRRILIAFVAVLFLAILAELAYLLMLKQRDRADDPTRHAVTALIGLPDMSLGTEARFVRHRSLSSVGSVLGEGGSLPEYFPSGHVYALPEYLHASGRIVHEH